MSLISHKEIKGIEEVFGLTDMTSLLLESVRANHFGLNSLEERYARIKPNKKEIESTLKYVSCFPDYLEDDDTALSFLSSEFAHVGITFAQNTNMTRPVNYPRSGIVWGNCDAETGLIYIFVNDTFTNILCKGRAITQIEFTQLTEDIYDQLIHEMTHRHQINKSKVRFKSNLPTYLDKDDSELTVAELVDKTLRYLSRIEEMDGFARQLAHQLSRNTSYDTAVKWMETNDPELLKYPVYASYWNNIGIIAANYKQMVKQDPNIAKDQNIQLARRAWPKFLWRVMYFLLSINRNHFKSPSTRIKGPERLP